MSFWKILGGAVAGGAFIATAPIAAPVSIAIGAITGALVGGVVPGPELDNKYEKFQGLFTTAVEGAKNQEELNALLLAIVTVGMSCAASDGDIASEEFYEIKGFCKNIGDDSRFDTIKAQMDSLIASPPGIEDAFTTAKTINLESMELFSEIVDLVITADMKEHEKEIDYRMQWQQLVAA
jgi:hypothetical protein